jgi:hypothetical protein
MLEAKSRQGWRGEAVADVSYKTYDVYSIVIMMLGREIREDDGGNGVLG